VLKCKNRCDCSVALKFKQSRSWNQFPCLLSVGQHVVDVWLSGPRLRQPEQRCQPRNGRRPNTGKICHLIAHNSIEWLPRVAHVVSQCAVLWISRAVVLNVVQVDHQWSLLTVRREFLNPWQNVHWPMRYIVSTSCSYSPVVHLEFVSDLHNSTNRWYNISENCSLLCTMN